MRLVAAIIAFALNLGAARGADIAIALTEDVVRVDAGFAGAKVILFGALSGAHGETARALAARYDIVAVVRGPQAKFRIRPMQREGAIWISGPAIDLEAPEILLVSAARALDEIASRDTLRALGAVADAAALAANLEPSPEAAAIIRRDGARAVSAAFVDHARKTGRFKEAANAVDFRKGALFSIDVQLAPATPVGDYAVDVFLFENGAVVSRDAAQLTVRKVGVERSIYELAYGQPIAYGLGCVFISLLAGWLAAAAFRK